MSLKESAQIRRYTNKEGVELIRDIVFKNVRFNYTYVSRPRPQTVGGQTTEGRYETNLIIHDPETWQVFEEAFLEIYENAVQNTWRGVRPALDKINVPFAAPKLKEDGTWGDFEEGAIAIIKANNNQAPELFLRLDDGLGLRQATEDDLDDFYSGMIGDAVVSFWVYDKAPHRPRAGIKLFLNGVCKTGVGDPIIFTPGNYNFLEAFSSGEDNAAAFAEKPNLNSLLGKKTMPAQATTPPVQKPVEPTPKPTPQPTPKPTPQPTVLNKGLLQKSEVVEPISVEAEEAPNDLLQKLISKGLTK